MASSIYIYMLQRIPLGISISSAHVRTERFHCDRVYVSCVCVPMCGKSRISEHAGTCFCAFWTYSLQRFPWRSVWPADAAVVSPRCIVLVDLHFCASMHCAWHGSMQQCYLPVHVAVQIASRPYVSRLAQLAERKTLNLVAWVRAPRWASYSEENSKARGQPRTVRVCVSACVQHGPAYPCHHHWPPLYTHTHTGHGMWAALQLCAICS